MDIKCPTSLAKILAEIPNTYLVGGCVRDALMGLNPKDFDVEVYKTNYDELGNKLAKYGKTDFVGKSFGVIKLTIDGETHDFSLARRDSLHAAQPNIPDNAQQKGHKAIKVDTTQDLTVEEGCVRRDLTINSMAYDPRTKQIIDPFGGIADLERKVLRHTSAQFVEDPLRVMRVMQFAGRFAFSVHQETIDLAKSIRDEYKYLSKERIWEEWSKFMGKAKKPSMGLNFLKDSGWIKAYPELEALMGCPQDPEWHPEGDVWTHTCHCCDSLAQDPDWKQLTHEEKVIHMFGILCHDLGKPLTTRLEFKPKVGRKAWVSPGHDALGDKPTEEFLKRIGAPHEVIRRTIPLVTQHMAHLQVSKDKEIRQLSLRVQPSSIAGLGLIIKADHSGRPPLAQGQPAEMEAILARANELNCLTKPPEQILKGRHISQWSTLEPGKSYGVLCKAAYDAQIQGRFHDEAGAKKWFDASAGKILEEAKLAPERFISGHTLVQLYHKPCKELGELHRDLFAAQLQGTIRNEQQAWEYVKHNSEKYKVPKENLKKVGKDEGPETESPSIEP